MAKLECYDVNGVAVFGDEQLNAMIIHQSTVVGAGWKVLVNAVDPSKVLFVATDITGFSGYAIENGTLYFNSFTDSAVKVSVVGLV